MVLGLKKLYPDAHSELNFRNEFELIVAVVLSAQCTDKKVNEVTPELFRRYPDPGKLALASVEAVQAIIRQVNYYRTKGKHLVELAGLLVTQHQGEVPKTHKELLALPGVGNKTANVVLTEGGLTPAFPVDTHVQRVSCRLELAEGKNPIEVERSLTLRFPASLWRDLHHQLIFHGRRVCIAQRPQCGLCELRSLCPNGGKLLASE